MGRKDYYGHGSEILLPTTVIWGALKNPNIQTLHQLNQIPCEWDLVSVILKAPQMTPMCSYV